MTDEVMLAAFRSAAEKSGATLPKGAEAASEPASAPEPPPAWGGAPVPGDDDAPPHPADDVAVLPPRKRTSGMPSGGATVEPSGPTSWVPAELGEILDSIASGQDVGPQPTMLARSDGGFLLYPGRLHLLFGEPESGKTWFALHACAERLTAGETVLYVDYEDTVASVIRRLLAVGAHPDAIRERFMYIAPTENVEMGDRDLAAALDREPTLTVIDAVTESLITEGLGINDNSEIAVWNARLPRRIARTGSAVLELDHVTKNRENQGRWPIGAQHKLAAVDVGYIVRVAKPFSRDRDGKLALKLAKDRHGGISGQGSGRQIAEITVRCHLDGLALTIDPPSGEIGDDGWRPTFLMERISKVLEVADGLNKREIYKRTKGQQQTLKEALDYLIADGYVRVEKGSRNAELHHSDRRYREADHTHSEHPDDEQPTEPQQGWVPL